MNAEVKVRVFEGAVYRNIAVSASEGKRKELMKIFGEKFKCGRRMYFFLKSLNMQLRGQNWKTHLANVRQQTRHLYTDQSKSLARQGGSASETFVSLVSQ